MIFGGKVLFMPDAAPFLKNAAMDWILFVGSFLLFLLLVLIPTGINRGDLPKVHDSLAKNCFALTKVKRVKLPKCD